MKQTLFLLIFLAMNLFSSAQQWDIEIPKEEKTPKHKTSRNRATAADFTNWGIEALLPVEIRQRVIDECKNKVVLKIADTGAKLTHTFLTQGQLPGSNYSVSGSMEDLNGHSTHVSGIAAGYQIGVLSSLIESGMVQFKGVKVLNDQGSGMFSWIANMAAGELNEDTKYLAAGTGVVYNFSLSGDVPKIESIEKAFKPLADKGVVFIGASGNSGKSGVNYPASSDYFIACGSLTKSLAKSSFSTTGKGLNNAMPGSGINSTYLNNSFATLSGTSMAAPFLSAVAVIAQSKWGKILHNHANMRMYLAWCASDIPPAGWDENTGWGIAYVKSVLNNNPVNLPPQFGKIIGGEPLQTNSYNIILRGNYPAYWISDIKPTQVRHNFTIQEITLKVDGPGTLDAEYQKTQKQISDIFAAGFGLILNNAYNDQTALAEMPVNIRLHLWEKYGAKVEVLKINATTFQGSIYFWEKK